MGTIGAGHQCEIHTWHRVKLSIKFHRDNLKDQHFNVINIFYFYPYISNVKIHDHSCAVYYYCYTLTRIGHS